jgi:SpoVK/Ycf46/Vps4 family AAA+-type ATPase
VLFGPPGTTKTSIVRAVAAGLGWPLVILSPGDFIAKGLEDLETQARSVFGRLRQLERTVVLFDECDELFRERKPSQQYEQLRSITAFVTASMLPKLQDLHEYGKVVFFICTNNFDSLDSAIKRPGRVDHIVGVGPPDQPARLAILHESLQSLGVQFQQEAIEELATATEKFTRGELIRAGRRLADRCPWSDVSSARKAARQVALLINPSRIVTDEMFTHFEDLLQKYSMPHQRFSSRPVTV